MRFLHAADVHLGYRQYNMEERLKDFERAFNEIGKTAAGAGDQTGAPVDFLLIAGDLFDDRSINARTYTQATEVLTRLKTRNIPVFVIEGNHDRAYHTDGMSWLQALDHRGLINLIRLRERNDLNYLGDYREMEVNGETARIYGVRYVGVQTPKIAEDLAAEVAQIEEKDPADLVVMMMHFGIDGQADAPGYSYNKILPLRKHVDYLALGHFHNAYSLENWLYNPGSVEATSVTEAGEARGVYLYDDGNVELLDLGGRTFRRFFVDITDATTPEEAYDLIQHSAHDTDAAIVDISLTGELRFDRSTLSRDGVEQTLDEDPLHVLLKVNATRDDLDVETGEMESRDAIEKKVFQTLAKNAGLPRKASTVMTEVKDLALNRAGSEEILDAVSTLLEEETREEGNETEIQIGSQQAQNPEPARAERTETESEKSRTRNESPAESGPSEGTESVEATATEGDEWNWRSTGAD